VKVDPEGWLLFQRVDAPPPGLRLLTPQPNPSGATGTALYFYLRDESRVTCDLYDARGRRRGHWELGLQPASGEEPEIWDWNGCDGAGRPLPAGIYWFELKAGEARAVQKVTLLR
jgi:hypothetical protein